MAFFTLQDLLQDVGAVVDQDTTLPSGTDLSVRVNLIDQALREWGNAYQWKSLAVVAFAPSVTLSTLSMGLPANFKKLMSRPFRMDVSTDNDYEEIRPDERYEKLSADPQARFCFTGGDESIGKFLVVNPALPSGASLLFDYQAHPSSMATLTDVCVCNSRSFMMRRVVGKIFESRSDPRFPTFMDESETSLGHLIEEEMALFGAFSNQTRSQYTQQNFRLGNTG